MQSVVCLDEIIDVDDSVHLSEIEDSAIIAFSPHNTTKQLSESSSGISSHEDELDFLKDFLSSENGESYKDDVSFADCSFLDEESLELCEYLSGEKGGNLIDQVQHGGRVVSDLELLKQQISCNQTNTTTQTQIQTQTPRVNKSDSATRSRTIINNGGYDPSMSKNAIAARENRLKKKQYLAHLEKTVKILAKENKRLKSAEMLKDSEIDKLKTEVKYLNNVILNQSTLSSLLKNISKTPSVTFKNPIVESISMPSIDGKCKPVHADNDNSSICRNGILKRKNFNECDTYLTQSSSKRRVTRSISSQQITENEGADENIKTSSSTGYEDCMIKNKSVDDVNISGGICLHVSGQQVSFEFCAQCNLKSCSRSISVDHSYVQSSNSN